MILCHDIAILCHDRSLQYCDMVFLRLAVVLGICSCVGLASAAFAPEITADATGMKIKVGFM